MPNWKLMPIEIKKLDLYARLLLAKLAVNRGYRVMLGQGRVIRRLARFLSKGIIFDNSIGMKGDRKVVFFARNKFI